MGLTRDTIFTNYAFILLLCLANALPNISDELHIKKRSPKDSVVHTFEEYANCNRDFRKSFNKIMMESLCMPRPAVVEIFSNSPSMLIVPSKVVVNRCEGMCHAKQTCLATEKKDIPIMVQQMDLLEQDAMPKCGVVYVEEHMRCKCKCTVMKEHCNEKQEYHPGECMCLCMNDYDRKSCMFEGKHWDDTTCTCRCPLEQECTTGEVWIHKYCSCAKLMGTQGDNVIVS